MVQTIICYSSIFDYGARFIYCSFYSWDNDASGERFGEVKDAFSVFLYNWTRITELHLYTNALWNLRMQLITIKKH